MLRQLQNDDLFQLYDSELVMRLHNAKNLSDTRKILNRFKDYLNGFPPSPELAKGFLAQYADKAPRTFYRYGQMLRVFMKWYGEPLDLKIRIPKSLPPYTEDDDIKNIFEAIESKKTHRGSIARDSLLLALALHSGMRRSELANLQAKDVHSDFVYVRKGKNDKDRVIPLPESMNRRLNDFVAGMPPEEKVFKLKGPCITMKIKNFARKAGLNDFHAHSARHKYAMSLLQKGVDIRSVQHLLGHESLSTTQVYLSVVDTSLKEAVSRLDAPGIAAVLPKPKEQTVGKFDREKWLKDLGPVVNIDPPDTPEWVKAITEMGKDGKNCRMKRDGRLEEVP